jgi:radical SAM superfamily enzyme YgiQ (UPF0313 family)
LTPSLHSVVLVAFGEEENLGVGYLMSVLHGDGISCRMIDFRYDNEEILAGIRRDDPIVVGFSVIFESCINEFVKLVTYLRKKGIDCHFTAGGYYASLHPEQLLAMIPELDSIVRFEGEYSFPELVNCLRKKTDWRKINSLAYLENGQVIKTPQRRLEENLDVFPFPVRRTLREYAMGQQYATIIAGRGCFYNCSFCNTSEFYRQAGGPLKRIRRPENVVSEMHQLYSEKGCRIFLFHDDDSPVRTAGGNMWMKSFCSELEQTGLLNKVIWKINCRPDEIDEDTFSFMKQHGMFLVFIGLEDGTDEGLKRLNKKMTVASSLRGIEILRKLEIEFDYGSIMFQPESTFTSLRENLEFLAGICRDGHVPLTFLKLTPYFGTRAERELREAGRLKGQPGNFDYNFISESLDACWSAVNDCFAHWLWGREGAVNLAKWVRNCLAVSDFFGKPNSDREECRLEYRDLVARSNLCLVDNLTELFDYYESGDYTGDADKRKEKIRADAERQHQLFSASLTKTLKHILHLSLAIIGFAFLTSCSDPVQTDLFIAGGGAGGVAAGLQASRMGVRTVLAEENEWLGGMLTSAGVSAVDGNNNLPGGIWGEFKNALENHYGGDSLLKTGWVSNVMFEPSVGNKIFSAMVAAEPNLTVLRNAYISRVKRSGDTWRISVRTTDGTLKYSAGILIDATELGDVAKMCGAKYDIGMDSRYDTGEEIAPAKANNIIQDLTYVAILKDYGREVPMIRPEGYDPSLFACSCINPLCSGEENEKARWSCELMLDYGKLQNSKYMINWPLSGNDFYVNLIEMGPRERAETLKEAKQKTLCFLWFIRNELGYRNLALADDEFPTADSLPFIPYYRESRRIRGKVRFTLNHITAPYDQPDKLYRTCIAVGDYPVDHHHSSYTGPESLPDLSFYPVPSFGLPLGALVPEDVEGLIVAEKSISVTNLVNGATRLQPVVLQAGQAAGALAALAAGEGVKISDVPVRDVQNALLNAGGYLLPYLDLPCDHEWFKTLQRIGSTGIMKGTGISQGWSNQTFFRANDVTLPSDLEGLKDIYPLTEFESGKDPLSVQQVVDLIRLIARQNSIEISEAGLSEALAMIFREGANAVDRPALRGETALLIDRALDPFNNREVNLKGEFMR